MKNLFYTLVGFTAISLMTIFCFVEVNKAQPVQGSVNIANEYQSTTTTAGVAVTPSCTRITPSDLTSGTLGSMVVGVAGVGTITVYDATTTATTTYVINGVRTDVGTTTLAKINTATQGTYQFDVMYRRGLCYEVSAATIGSTTITSR